MSRPWLTVVIILGVSFVLNVGFMWLTMVFPQQLLPPLPGM